jgi:protein-disulfide isomerase
MAASGPIGVLQRPLLSTSHRRDRRSLRIVECVALAAAMAVIVACKPAPNSTANQAEQANATTPAPAAAAQPTQIRDTSALRPPAGARIAIVEFADLECPACAAANPRLKAAVAQYNIPWVRHDFLIPSHNWSRQAAINARWFGLKSPALGDEYRDEVFANQASIVDPAALAQFTQKFASDRHIGWPVMGADPDGKLAAAVEADNDLGKRTGVTLTPTIFIVYDGATGPAYIQVRDASQDLFQTIDQALAATRGR